MTNDFGNLWLQGTQIGAGIAGSAMDRNLRMQELRSQEAVRQLQERQVAQQMSMQLYQHNMMVDAQADRVKATAAMQADMLLHPATFDVPKPIPFMDQPDEGTTRETVSVPNPNGILPEDAYMKHVFPVDQKWQGILPGGRGSLDTLADYARVKRERQLMAEGGGFRPYGTTVTLPNSGKVIEGIQKSRNEFAPYIDPSIQMESYVDPDTGQTVQRPVLRQGMTGGRALPEDIGKRQAAESERQAKQKLIAEALSVDRSKVNLTVDANGKEQVTLSPEAWSAIQKHPNITTGTKTQLEQQEFAAEKVADKIEALFPKITPSTIGPTALVKRYVVNKGLANLFPNMKIGNESEVATEIRELRGDIFRMMRSDSNIGQKEVASIESASPDAQTLLTSPQEAKSQMIALLEGAGRTSRLAAQSKGTPVNPMWWTRGEIAQKIANHEITDADGVALWKRSMSRVIDAFRLQEQQ